jgi:hypothetical protein
MAEGFSVSPDSIDQTSQEFSDISDIARRIPADTESQLDELGKFAGDDHYGQLFDDVFTPGFKSAQGVVLGTSTGLDQTTTDLQTTSKFYREANDRNTDLTGKLV